MDGRRNKFEKLHYSTQIYKIKRIPSYGNIYCNRIKINNIKD